MKKLWPVMGVVGFWLLSPLFFIYLRLNARTRIIIKHKGKILLVKPWLSTGQWDFPGGGLHIDETPAQGVIRETFEETGIKLSGKSVKSLGLASGRGVLPPRTHCFCAELEKEPVVKKQFIEVIDIRWVEFSELEPYNLTPFSRICLDLWKRDP